MASLYRNVVHGSVWVGLRAGYDERFKVTCPTAAFLSQTINTRVVRSDAFSRNVRNYLKGYSTTQLRSQSKASLMFIFESWDR
jgi:hypothetical protein